MTKREIKFRVFGWELDEEKWVLNPYNKIYTSGKLVIEESFFSRNIGERYVEQYTGLEDANGVEIYEGDILKDEYGNYAVVIFYDGRFVAREQGSDMDLMMWLSDYYGQVSGNVHQHPELLRE